MFFFFNEESQINITEGYFMLCLKEIFDPGHWICATGNFSFALNFKNCLKNKDWRLKLTANTAFIY